MHSLDWMEREREREERGRRRWGGWGVATRGFLGAVCTE